MKTLGRFVLVHSDKKEIYLDWKLKHMTQTAEPSLSNPTMQYRDRKNLIRNLQPIDNTKQKSISHGQTDSSLHKNNKVYVSTCKDQFGNGHSTSKLRRSKSMGLRQKAPAQLRQPLGRQTKTDEQKVLQMMRGANVCRKGGKVVCVMAMRRDGLRHKVSHGFLVVRRDTEHNQFAEDVKKCLIDAFPARKQGVYLFHLAKQPIHKISADLNEREYVIFADSSPKLNVVFDIQMDLFTQASHFEQIIRKCQLQLETEQPASQSSSIGRQLDGRLVESIVENPELVWELQPKRRQVDDIEGWCGQKFVEDVGQEGSHDKNPFFDVKTHFPSETTDQALLERVMSMINQHPNVTNTHQIKQRPIANLMETVKREKEHSLTLKKQEEARAKTIGYKSGKSFCRLLDQKAVPLVQQNIPYMMAKYGITRAEAYDLHSLYKSLQKISAMRLYGSNEHQTVKEKGIDRQTFDEGLKGLEINPGEEVIRNICQFPEFIKWEEFIKIISISLRKTTQSKLEAILESIGSSSSGCLTRSEIKIMIGSSLAKIFGKEQPPLRDHFVNIVMQKMDADSSGTIECQELKDYVLGNNTENGDLISYLILNS